MRNCTRFIAFTFASTVTAINLAINQTSAFAQSIQGGAVTPECMAALRTAKNKIEKGKNVSVVDIPKKDIRQEYEEYPQNRPFSYNFYLDFAMGN